MITRRVIYTSILLGFMASYPAFAVTSYSVSGSTNAKVHKNQSAHSGKMIASNITSQKQSSEVSKKSRSGRKIQQLKGLTVTGIRRSQMQAIELKRTAPEIEDSITSVSIGQLPDITITDSLSRVTGVQIDRVAGEGTTVNVRGLPEVASLINGAPFISSNNIYSIQPNYETLPSPLFLGVDVYKSPTANLPVAGISGTINLRTRQPWDLPFGWTVAGGVAAARGSVASETRPKGNVLVAYNANGKWGILFDVAHSNMVHSYERQGFQACCFSVMGGENSSAASIPSLGYLTEWGSAPLPSQIKRLADGGVDVNGDGKSDGAFYSAGRYKPVNELIQPIRTGFNAAFQYAFGHGITLNAQGFVSKETEYTALEGFYLLPISQTAPAMLPLVSRNTGVILHSPTNAPGQQLGNWDQSLYTTQKYNAVIGEFDPSSVGSDDRSISRNFNLALKFDNDGPFRGSLRWINASASASDNRVEAELTDSDGSIWPSELKPGVSLPNSDTVYVHPASQGGNFPFNPNGFPPYAFSGVIDSQHKNQTLTLPSAVYSRLDTESTFVDKNLYGRGSQSGTSMNILSFTGNYQLSNKLNVDFGFRNSIRSASNEDYAFATRVYAGDGASDTNGCLVRWGADDAQLDGAGIPGTCVAGNSYGYFRENPLAGPLSQLPPVISNNIVRVVNPGGVKNVAFWAINGNAMKHAWSFYKAAMGNATRVPMPSTKWDVLMHTNNLYAQANFNGKVAGFSFSGNAGVRVIRTNLLINQSITGPSLAYGLPLSLASVNTTKRHYTDVLPAANISIKFTPRLILRLAASKNMMPLSLNLWGGGVLREFLPTILPNNKLIQGVIEGVRSGNPQLDPWRSTNSGVSIEYYMSPTSLISLAAFRTNVSSFIVTSGSNSCNLADADGVVRRCVPVVGPEQGNGATLHGFEFDYRQGLEFLPGILSNTGFEFNSTFSPSSTGKRDITNKPVPFPDNSKYVGNLILWYQSHRFQARIGGNYRSKRMTVENYSGINGLELYQRATFYLSASLSYQVNPHIQIYAQGQNLTNERAQYYVEWPDQKAHTNISERYYFIGARFRF